MPEQHKGKDQSPPPADQGLHFEQILPLQLSFCASATKMQETRNKMPAASVYLLENLHFLQFFVADSVPGSIIMCKGDR